MEEEGKNSCTRRKRNAIYLDKKREGGKNMEKALDEWNSRKDRLFTSN